MTITENPIRNGVGTATLFATLDAVRSDNELAKFRFRAANTWVSGTHNRSTINGFYGARQEMTHREPFTFDADHPPVLVGADRRRSSTCCTHSPPASLPASPTSLRRAA
jgi:hypothetical protein